MHEHLAEVRGKTIALERMQELVEETSSTTEAMARVHHEMDQLCHKLAAVVTVMQLQVEKMEEILDRQN